MMERLDPEVAEAVMQRIAQIASALANAAGVGEVETVGHIVSYLLDHPRDIEPCMRFGVVELPEDWLRKGSLTYHASDGKIWDPRAAHRARTVKQMEPRP